MIRHLYTSIFARTLLVVATLLFSQVALAENRAAACTGCSSDVMKRLAERLTNDGTVLVFDALDGRVETYRVSAQVLTGWMDTLGFSAVRVSTDPEIEAAWIDVLDAFEQLTDGRGVIVLPPDFPLRSVAGALVDPIYATTAIENHILRLSGHRQLELAGAALAGRFKNIELPLFDLENIVSEVTITVRFPDGSTLQFTIEFSVDQQTLRSRMELQVHGNAMDADGRPAPTSALGFRDRTYRDHGGSLIEWLQLARGYGIPISGGSTGGDDTAMECKVEGAEIRCTVTRKGR